MPQTHRSAALDGCHREAAHQGQKCSLSLMQECFWWPGMAQDLQTRIRKCGRCRKFEAATPIAPMQPLTCSGPGELLHMDFTSIEETVPLREEPVIKNVMVMQDHFSKYVVAYVVKDQTARTAAETLRNGYFSQFGAPAYLVSDQGKAFTSHLISNLCELYVCCMYAVTGFSPYFLIFGRKLRMPVDYLFPTICDSPHQTRMEVSVAAMQKRLKEAFAVTRQLSAQEAAKQQRYYDRKAGAVVLQPGDVVMVRTDGFVGKRKVKDQWEDGGFIVENQLEDWPVYRIRCPTTDARQKPKFWTLHQNRLLLVTREDDPVASGQSAQAEVNPTVSNATLGATGVQEGSFGPLPSLVTQQAGDQTPRAWLNGEFRTTPWAQSVSQVPESPQDLSDDGVSDPGSDFSDSEIEGT